MANIAESSGKYSTRRSGVLYLSQDPHQELYLSYKQSVSALSVLLYFTPINVRIKHSPLIVLNKGIAQINGFL